MADRKEERAGLPSVLDRLLDDEPGLSVERPMTVRQLGEALKDAVRRDLENLLNRRRRPLELPKGLGELENSSFDYGIPDFSGANLSSKQKRQRYIKVIEGIIRRHEPRFSAVKVVPVESRETGARTLHFRIEAILRTEPAPESVLYDSLVDVVTRSFRVQI